jgi:hypothetical protein
VAAIRRAAARIASRSCSAPLLSATRATTWQARADQRPPRRGASPIAIPWLGGLVEPAR